MAEKNVTSNTHTRLIRHRIHSFKYFTDFSRSQLSFVYHLGLKSASNPRVEHALQLFNTTRPTHKNHNYTPNHATSSRSLLGALGIPQCYVLESPPDRKDRYASNNHLRLSALPHMHRDIHHGILASCKLGSTDSRFSRCGSGDCLAEGVRIGTTSMVGGLRIRT